jgi:inactivated superfamily I helicase
MSPIPITTPTLRRELRTYLVRYRHMQPQAIALGALNDLEAALHLLEESVPLLPPERGQRARAFLTQRLRPEEGV